MFNEVLADPTKITKLSKQNWEVVDWLTVVAKEAAGHRSRSKKINVKVVRCISY